MMLSVSPLPNGLKNDRLSKPAQTDVSTPDIPVPSPGENWAILGQPALKLG